MRSFGLIGYPLGHSFSAKYFAEKFDAQTISDVEYRNFPIESIEMLPEIIAQNPTLCGFNVTIPYKEQILPYLDSLSLEATEIGAVNCVKIEKGKLIGHNTDAHGFCHSLLTLIGESRPSALILGTGGASKAVRYALTSLGINYRQVSRNRSENTIAYEDVSLQTMADYPLIINTTPLGTHPNTDAAPQLTYEGLTSANYLFDLVYNPPLTKFLAEGKTHGAQIQNGYDMLIGQAERSWEIWNS